MQRRPDIKGKSRDTGDQKTKGGLPRSSTRRRIHDVHGVGASVPPETQPEGVQAAMRGAKRALKGLGDSSQEQEDQTSSSELTSITSDKGNEPSQISDEQAIAKLSLKYIQEKGKEALFAYIDKTITVKSKIDLTKTQFDYIFTSISNNLRNKTGEERISAINEYLNQEGSTECFIFKRLVRKKKEELAKELSNEPKARPSKRRKEDTAGFSSKTIEQMQESDIRVVSHLTEKQRYIHDGIPIDTTKLNSQRLKRLSDMNDAIYKKSRGGSNPGILPYYREIINRLDRIIEGKWVEGSKAPKDPNEALFQVLEAIKQPPGGMKGTTVTMLREFVDEIKGWMRE